MSESEAGGTAQNNTVAGEGMPEWLTFAFALIGLLTAVAAVWVFLSDGSTRPGPPSGQVAVAMEGSRPSAIVPPAKLPDDASATSAERPSTVVFASDSVNAPPQASPSPAVEGAGKRVESPTHHAPVANALVPSSALVVCPRSVTIFFRGNSARPIGSGTTARLAPLRKWLAAHPEARLLVEGHADPTGKEQWNLILSYRRAKAVADMFRNFGVSEEQLVVRAAGQLQPITGRGHSASANRRVVLQIEGGMICRTFSSDSEPR